MAAQGRRELLNVVPDKAGARVSLRIKRAMHQNRRGAALLCSAEPDDSEGVWLVKHTAQQAGTHKAETSAV